MTPMMHAFSQAMAPMMGRLRHRVLDARQVDVDQAIDRCGAVYNMWQEMAKCRLKLENAESDDEQELATCSTPPRSPATPSPRSDGRWK